MGAYEDDRAAAPNLATRAIRSKGRVGMAGEQQKTLLGNFPRR